MTDEVPQQSTSLRRAMIVLVIAALVQVAVASLGPLDGDESLYWEWSRHLAWGYYDHPPGIALLIHLGTSIFGVTPFGVRIFSLLAGFLAAMLVVVLARRHGGERAGFRAALIVSCMPLLPNWLMFATPDAPLFLAEMCVLILVDSALSAGRGSSAMRWWILAGFALGFAALAKELAILLPAGMFIAFLTHRDLRPRLAEPGPYVACAIAAVMIIPLALWNRDHDWVLLQFVLHRGLGAEPGNGAGRVLEMLGGQLALVSPLLLVLLGNATIRAARAGSARVHLLAVVALSIFGWFVIAAWRHQVEPNWLLMAYPAAAIVLAQATASRWFNTATAVGAGFVLVLYMHTVTPVLPIAALRDPIRRGHGWKELAAGVDSTRRVFGARATRVAGNRFQEASQLAFHLADHPFVYSLNIESRPNQYDFWPGFAQQAKTGDGLILVVDDVVGVNVVERLRPSFDQVTAGARVIAGGDDPVLVPKRLWIFEGWRGTWPAH